MNNEDREAITKLRIHMEGLHTDIKYVKKTVDEIKKDIKENQKETNERIVELETWRGSVMGAVAAVSTGIAMIVSAIVMWIGKIWR